MKFSEECKLFADWFKEIETGGKMSNLAATPLKPSERGGRSITILVANDVVNRFAHDPTIAKVLVNDFTARDEYGYGKHGQNLETNDGRPTVWDIYQELLDACQYSRKQIEEGTLLPGMECVYPTLLEITRMTREAILNSEGKEEALKWEVPSETADIGHAEIVRADDPEEYTGSVPERVRFSGDIRDLVRSDAGRVAGSDEE